MFAVCELACRRQFARERMEPPGSRGVEPETARHRPEPQAFQRHIADDACRSGRHQANAIL
jgi:hypothetical protein